MTMKVNLHNRQNRKNKIFIGVCTAPDDRRKPAPHGAHGGARGAIRAAFSGIVGE
ncbi:hypothetical protein [Burkholderia humptydooensis]|uniref:hypothetical protein n=1 Tax=Burkholderia humptydooensis TaxID=430531 RepID=UPI0012FDCE4D|nr:hypothetical protein [Burkholderia humptydooensis]